MPEVIALQLDNSSQTTDTSNTSESSWNFNHPTVLVPGLLANCIRALLDVTEADLKMSIDWGHLFEQMNETVNKESLDYQGIMDRLGDKEQGEARTTGFTTLGSGACMTVVGLGGGMIASRSLNGMDDEINGLTNTRKFINEHGGKEKAIALNKGNNNAVDDQLLVNDDTRQKTLNRLVEKDPKEFKGLGKKVDFKEEEATFSSKDGKPEGTYKYKEAIENAGPKEIKELKTKFNEKIKETKGDFSVMQNKVTARTQRITQLTQALGSVATGGGTVVSGDYKKAQEEERANQTSCDSSLKMAQSLAGTTSGNATTYIGKAYEVSSTVSAIASYNKQ